MKLFIIIYYYLIIIFLTFPSVFSFSLWPFFFPLFIFQLFLIFLFVSVLSLTQNLSYQGDTVMGHYWPVTSWEAG